MVLSKWSGNSSCGVIYQSINSWFGRAIKKLANSYVIWTQWYGKKNKVSQRAHDMYFESTPISWKCKEPMSITNRQYNHDPYT